MIPVDKKRCQAYKPNGLNALTIGGVPKLIRCENIPTIVAIENKKGPDGKKGAMSLCNDCLEVAKKQLPINFFKTIQLEKYEPSQM